MIWTIVIILVFLILVLWAVRTKIFIKRTRGAEVLDNTVASPASAALGELVAVAGGIYLSLVLVSSFLKLSTPDKIKLLDMSLDPMALVAIIIALFQPIIMALYHRLLK